MDDSATFTAATKASAALSALCVKIQVPGLALLELILSLDTVHFAPRLRKRNSLDRFLLSVRETP